jgi:hypothetical protein
VRNADTKPSTVKQATEIITITAGGGNAPTADGRLRSNMTTPHALTRSQTALVAAAMEIEMIEQIVCWGSILLFCLVAGYVACCLAMDDDE